LIVGYKNEKYLVENDAQVDSGLWFHCVLHYSQQAVLTAKSVTDV